MVIFNKNSVPVGDRKFTGKLLCPPSYSSEGGGRQAHVQASGGEKEGKEKEKA